MITMPGQHKFKLRRIDPPIIRKEDKYEFTVECPELRESSCPTCHAGQIEVAYGETKGVFDVYQFPCKCSHVNGYEWEQLINEDRYTNRPVAYFCKEDDIPGYVFIHPIHKRGFAKVIARIRQIKARHQAESTGELPF